MTWVTKNGIPNHCAPNTKRLGIYTLLSGTSKEDRGSWFNLKQLSVRAVKQFDTIDGRNPQPVARLSHYLHVFSIYIPFAAGFPLSRVCLISKNQTAADIKIPAPAATPEVLSQPARLRMEKTRADSWTGILHWPVTLNFHQKKRVFMIFHGQKQQSELGRLLSSTVFVQRKHFCKLALRTWESRKFWCVKKPPTHISGKC